MTTTTWAISHGMALAQCADSAEAEAIQNNVRYIGGRAVERDGRILYCAIWTQEEYSYAIDVLGEPTSDVDQHTCDMEDEVFAELRRAGQRVEDA